MADRNNAGRDIDPGIVQSAAAQLTRQRAVAAQLGLQPGAGSGRAIPARVKGAGLPGADQPAVDRTTAGEAQPQSIVGIQQAWMSPLDPIVPSAPANVRGRALDYLVGWNITPPSNRPGQASMSELRGLARNCGLVAVAIEKRKNQLEQGRVDFKLKGDKTGLKTDGRIDELRKFFQFPDRRRTMTRWLRKLADDILVLDQPCLWIEKNRAGKPYQIRVIDSATIKPLIDADGEIPLPPAPAFQQWLKGVPAADYSAAAGVRPDASFTYDELLWYPRNPRPDTVLGYSPVEQIYVEVNLAIRRQLMILAGYTEGTIPEALVPTPETWKLEQIKDFQIYWDEILGNSNYKAQRGLRFVPNGMDKAVFTKKWQDHTDYDEWLARFVMAAFGLPPTAFVKQMTHGAAAEQQQASQDDGQLPFLNFVIEIINILILKYWGWDDIEAVFRQDQTSDEAKHAEASAARVKAGLRTINEERGADGLDPYDPQYGGDVPTYLTATGPVALQPVAPTDAHEGQPGFADKPAPPPAPIVAAGPAAAGKDATGKPAGKGKTKGADSPTGAPLGQADTIEKIADAVHRRMLHRRPTVL